MTEDLFFGDTLVSVKCNKTLKTLPIHLYEIIQLLIRAYSDKYSTQLCLVLYIFAT